MAMANHPEFSTVDWSALVISVGGAWRCSRPRQAVAGEDRLPHRRGYGLSETSPTLACNPTDSTAYSGTIGLPLPLTDIRLLDDDDGRKCPWASRARLPPGPAQVMAGYWQRPDETAKVMTADGYFRTGDVGVVDERGYFKIVDRKKDMILVSGFNVYPNEVEDADPDARRAGVRRWACPTPSPAKRSRSCWCAKTPTCLRPMCVPLRSQSDRLQTAQDRRVPHRPAQDTGWQGAAT